MQERLHERQVFVALDNVGWRRQRRQVGANDAPGLKDGGLLAYELGRKGGDLMAQLPEPDRVIAQVDLRPNRPS